MQPLTIAALLAATAPSTSDEPAPGSATPAPFVEKSATQAASAPRSAPPSPSQWVSDDPVVLKRRLDWHEERDQNLRQLTIGFGIATAGLGAISGALLASTGRAETASAQTALTGGGATLAAVAGTAAIGTIISGVVLGNHRNSRGFFLR